MTVEKTRRIFSTICNTLYILGFAWHPLGGIFKAKDVPHRSATLLYKFYSFFITLYCCGTIGLEAGAILFGDLPKHKLIMATEFVFGHSSVIGKQLTILYNRKLISQIVDEIVFKLPAIYNNDKLSSNAASLTKKYILAVVIFMTMTLMIMSIDDILYFLANTSNKFAPFPIYWPSFDDGILMSLAYYIIPNIGFMLITTTFMTIDFLVLSVLIHLALRFKLLQHYIENLDEICEQKLKAINTTTRFEDVINKTYRDELVKIIKLHDDTLKCAEKVQKAFNFVFLMELLQGLSMLMPSLGKVLVDRSASSIVFGIIMIPNLMLLLGTYTSNAGNVSYEASQVCNSIYASNWYQHPELKPYFLILLARAQRPVVLYCGGIFEVTHQTFVTICRASYSVFAIIF